MRGRVVAYSSSPLLAARTPVWRSKFIVAGLALAFLGLAARAAWVQVIGNDFYLRQGEVRFARTLELPANRGRIFDRNGLLLASSVPVPSIWAIPEDVERDPTKLAQLAHLAAARQGLFKGDYAAFDSRAVSCEGTAQDASEPLIENPTQLAATADSSARLPSGSAVSHQKSRMKVAQ